MNIHKELLETGFPNLALIGKIPKFHRGFENIVEGRAGHKFWLKTPYYVWFRTVACDDKLIHVSIWMRNGQNIAGWFHKNMEDSVFRIQQLCFPKREDYELLKIDDTL